MTSSGWVVVIILLTCVTCSLVGCFLVLRRSAMTADAVSHSVLPGIVFAFWISGGLNLFSAFLGAVGAGALTVGLTKWLTRFKLKREDAALGIVFPALFSVGVIWVSVAYRQVHLDTDAILLGEVLLAPFEQLQIGTTSLGPVSVWLLGPLLVLATGYLKLFQKELILESLDPSFAKVSAPAASQIGSGLTLLLCLAVVASFTAVGVVLAIALLIVPTAVGRLWTDSLRLLIWLSVGIACLAGGLGLFLAFGLNLSVSGRKGKSSLSPPMYWRSILRATGTTRRNAG
ncbi:MAG: metal ABC transporter permease [Fimbriimonadaceae bacterium]|nr:metal ABC transporter permease [Fimbriimonadaceae bacterium]